MIEKLFIKTAEEICLMATGVAGPSGFAFPLKNPPFSAPTLRISEQEARQVFIDAVKGTKSATMQIEAPTSWSYSFTGTSDRSANIDLYAEVKNRKWNIEFKNGNVNMICKDVVKLIWEPECGAMFNLVEKYNTATIKSLFEKYRNAFKHAKTATTSGSKPTVEPAAELDPEKFITIGLLFLCKSGVALPALSGTMISRFCILSKPKKDWIATPALFDTSDTPTGPIKQNLLAGSGKDYFIHQDWKVIPM